MNNFQLWLTKDTRGRIAQYYQGAIQYFLLRYHEELFSMIAQHDEAVTFFVAEEGNWWITKKETEGGKTEKKLVPLIFFHPEKNGKQNGAFRVYNYEGVLLASVSERYTSEQVLDIQMYPLKYLETDTLNKLIPKDSNTAVNLHYVLFKEKFAGVPIYYFSESSGHQKMMQAFLQDDSAPLFEKSQVTIIGEDEKQKFRAQKFGQLIDSILGVNKDSTN